ncbi:VWA domain-containing protein [Streptomyces sp. NPDC088400]|uniref:VWA domain-containing protein n=1 Tax=Streptomyces sp. NPDC088400 TaxID=3365861 RepID=UPI00381C9C33
MRSNQRSQRNLRHPISRSRPVSGERGRSAPRTTALAGVLLALVSTFAATGAGPGSAARAPGDTRAVSEGADPIDFVVLVDQSKSLSDKDLSREVEAAALLSQGEISERSRAAVIGFSSSEKNGQSEVREVCELTVVDKSGREHLSDCVKQLSRRDSTSMGPGTDFPAALRQALTRLKEGGRPGTPKVIFLLTDGKLDVRDSPQYGADPTSRQKEAAEQLTEELSRARKESVQIWPLGFGGEIDRAALTEMAAGGFRNGCSYLASATPHMQVLDSSAEIDKVLQKTFAAARCAQVVQGSVGKPPADLKVKIPKIATDGSITVSKHDPKVTATYYDPRGKKVPTHGPFDGSTFEVTGQDGPVEALRVKNPRPGTWRVHLEAPEGHQGREVAVRAIWQGKLRSSVRLTPTSPRPGEQAVVEVRMQTRRGVVIDDPALLKGIKVAARLSGSGFDALTVPLSDNGKAPDARAGDVMFSGKLTVPDTATGDLALTAEMTAPGVTGDHRPLNARVTSGTPPVTAELSVERGNAHPGDVVKGTVAIKNTGDEARRLRLALADQAAGSGLRISPATVEVAPGEDKNVGFGITLGSKIAPGEVGARVTVADLDDDGRVLDNTFIGVVVEPVPTWWEQWWGAVVAGAAVLLALAVFTVVQLGARRRRRDLAGVRLELRGEGVGSDELTVRQGQTPGGDFHFVVDRSRGAAPSLQRGGPAAAATHRLRRTSGGEFLLRPHQGRERTLRPGEAASLGDGLEIVVHDRRTAGRPGRRDRDGGRDVGRDGGRDGGRDRTGDDRSRSRTGRRTASSDRDGRGDGRRSARGEGRRDGRGEGRGRGDGRPEDRSADRREDRREDRSDGRVRPGNDDRRGDQREDRRGDQRGERRRESDSPRTSDGTSGRPPRARRQSDDGGSPPNTGEQTAGSRPFDPNF